LNILFVFPSFILHFINYHTLWKPALTVPQSSIFILRTIYASWLNSSSFNICFHPAFFLAGQHFLFRIPPCPPRPLWFHSFSFKICLHSEFLTGQLRFFASFWDFPPVNEILRHLQFSFAFPFFYYFPVSALPFPFYVLLFPVFVFAPSSVTLHLLFNIQ